MPGWPGARTGIESHPGRPGPGPAYGFRPAALDPTPSLAAPQGSPATIDGVFTPGEWDDALEIDLANSQQALDERAEHLEREKWLASNGLTGKPDGMEYQIAMPGGELRLGVAYLLNPEYAATDYWPDTLAALMRETDMELAGWLVYYVSGMATQLDEVQEKGKSAIRVDVLVREHGFKAISRIAQAMPEHFVEGVAARHTCLVSTRKLASKSGS